MNIDLRVNSVAFTVDEELHARKLSSAKCEKPGFLDRLSLKPPNGQVVYWAKNCEISCFNGEFRLWANLDRSRGSAEMAGTSAYLYFANLILEKVAFQVLLNETMATGGIAAFQRLCKSAFGAPAPDSPACWMDSNGVVSCALYHTRDKALFTWMTRRYMQEHGLSA
jgi:hypothetical protein